MRTQMWHFRAERQDGTPRSISIAATKICATRRLRPLRMTCVTGQPQTPQRPIPSRHLRSADVPGAATRGPALYRRRRLDPPLSRENEEQRRKQILRKQESHAVDEWQHCRLYRCR